MLFNNHKSAFGLAETAVIVFVVSVMVGAFYSNMIYNMRIAHRAKTVKHAAVIEDAVKLYLQREGCLPLPTDLGTNVLSDSTYNHSKTIWFGHNVKDLSYKPSDTDCLIGGVPTADLGISSKYMYDGWGRRYRYVVAALLTQNKQKLLNASTVNMPITVTFKYDKKTERTVRAAYILVSNGRNGSGAYKMDGTMATCDTSKANAMNCDTTCNFVDLSYLSSATNEGNGDYLLQVGYDKVAQFVKDGL